MVVNTALDPVITRVLHSITLAITVVFLTVTGDIMTTKVCARKSCDKSGIAQPVSNFSKSKADKSGYQSYCKSCSVKVNRNRVAAKSGTTPKSRKLTRIMREKRIAFVKSICGDKDLAAISIADFEAKVVKRALELSTADKIKHKGGFIGITGPAALAHYLTHSPNMKSKSIFMIAEHNTHRRRLIRKNLASLPEEDRKKIIITGKDIFNALKHYEIEHPNPTTPMFSNVHLDFCVTAETLVEDQGFIKKLKGLAKSSHLKNNSYIDITS